jgi:hypothetical protein
MCILGVHGAHLKQSTQSTQGQSSCIYDVVRHRWQSKAAASDTIRSPRVLSGEAKTVEAASPTDSFNALDPRHVRQESR